MNAPQRRTTVRQGESYHGFAIQIHVPEIGLPVICGFHALDQAGIRSNMLGTWDRAATASCSAAVPHRRNPLRNISGSEAQKIWQTLVEGN